MSPQRPVFNFKLVYTCNVFSVEVDPSWTPMGLYESIQNKVLQQFSLLRFEIVEAGQDVIYGHAEQAEALVLSNNQTLYEIYGERILEVTFYIRPLDVPSSSINNNIVNDNNTIIYNTPINNNT